MRVLAVWLQDIRFQWRHGFYAVYGLICSLYIVLLHYIPDGESRHYAALLLIFSDPSALGLLLAGGIVLLERDQGIHDPLFVTPLRLREYMLSKAVSLSTVSVCAAWAVHMAALGLPESPIVFTTGVWLTSSLFTFLSIGIAVRCRSVNGFILLSQVYALPFALPILGVFGIGEPIVYLLFPTNGSLLLINAASEAISFGDILYSLLILFAGNASVYAWAYQSFKRKLLLRIGRGEPA